MGEEREGGPVRLLRLFAMEVEEDDGWADDGDWEEIEEAEEISSSSAPPLTVPALQPLESKRRKLDPPPVTPTPTPPPKAADAAETAPKGVPPAAPTAAAALPSPGADDTSSLSGKRASYPAIAATSTTPIAAASARPAAAGAANQDTQPHPVTVTKPAPVHDTDVAAAPLALAAGPAASVAGALLPVAPVAENVHATRRVEFVEGELAPVVKVGAIHFRVIPLQAIRIPGSFSERYRS